MQLIVLLVEASLRFSLSLPAFWSIGILSVNDKLDYNKQKKEKYQYINRNNYGVNLDPEYYRQRQQIIEPR